MKVYATFLMFGALSVMGCASSEKTPISEPGGITSAAGMSAAAAGAPASGAAGTPAAANAGRAAAPAQSGAAGTPTATANAGSAAKPATGAAGMGGSPAAAGGGGTPASSSSAAPGSFRAAWDKIGIQAMCGSCHVMGSVIGSPDFSSIDKAYETLIDKDATAMAPGQCSGKGKLVTPGNCETSLLYNKLSQDTPMCGRRMPPSSDSAPVRVPQDALDALCDWIKAGAKKD